MRDAFADYIGVDPNMILDDDIPIVAIAGSGGGALEPFPTSFIPSFFSNQPSIL